MSEKPRVFELLFDAKDFWIANYDFWWDSAKVLFFLTIVLNTFFLAAVELMGFGNIFDPEVDHEILGKQMLENGSIWQLSGLLLLIIVAGLYLHACFILAWHRNVLTGPDKSHRVNPFKINGDEFKFIITVFILLLLLGLTFLAWPIFTAITTGASSGGGALLTIIAAIFSTICALVLFFAALRNYFVLPALSIGVSMSWKEARSYSKGLLRKWVIAFIILAIPTNIIYWIFEALFGFVEALLPFIVTGSVWERIFDIVSFIPTLFVSFIFTALNVTILSRLYQWSVRGKSGVV